MFANISRMFANIPRMFANIPGMFANIQFREHPDLRNPLALVVWLSQVASVLELGLKTHMKPSFDPLVSLQPELCAVPRGH